jgi:hypothetical protein
MSELKPCPFCGSKAILCTGYKDAGATYKNWWIICDGCDIGTGNYDTEEGIIRYWNNRPETAWEMLARLRKEYGTEFHRRLAWHFGMENYQYYIEVLNLLKEDEPEAKKIMQEIDNELQKSME